MDLPEWILYEHGARLVNVVTGELVQVTPACDEAEPRKGPGAVCPARREQR